MTKQKSVMDDVRPARLLEIADKDVRLTQGELDHSGACSECAWMHFAKNILQAEKKAIARKQSAS